MDKHIDLYQSLIGCTIDEIGISIETLIVKIVPKGKVFWRVKDSKTLQRKMVLNNKTSIETIKDIYAYRIIVNTDQEVYMILDVISLAFKGKLKKDYIKQPKRLYSEDPIILRLVQYIAERNSVFFEIQITTWQYHNMNESCHGNYHLRKYGPQL